MSTTLVSSERAGRDRLLGRAQEIGQAEMAKLLAGTGATMDAIRVARAATGRDVVCKIEGSYHGHLDSVMFSVIPNADTMGGRERPASAPVSKGMVKDASKYIEVVPFNDADHLERVFAEK